MKRDAIEGSIRKHAPEISDESLRSIIDEVMDANGKDINRLKADVEKATSELEALRSKAEEYEKYRQATMSDEEKRREAAEMTDKLNNELKSRLNRLSAEKMFVKAGFTEDDYNPVLDRIVVSDEKATEESAKTFIDLLEKTRKQTEDETKSKMVKSTPRPENGASSKQQAVTREQLAAMSYSQRVQFKAENPELYEQLNN